MSDSTCPPQLHPLRHTDGPVRAIKLLTLSLLVMLGAGLGVPIDGAVIAPGRVLVEGRPQPVQSLEAGIVTQVSVRNGDHVKPGQILLELDSTTTQARLQIALDRLVLAQAESARFHAEAEDQTQIAFIFTFPDLPIPAPDTQSARQHQTALFIARRQQRADADARLIETLAQFDAQKAGLRAGLDALEKEKAFLAEEIDRHVALSARGLGRQAPLGDLNRQRAALVGRSGQMEAEFARLQGAMRDAQLAHAEATARRAEDVALGLRDRSTEVNQILSEITSLHDTLKRSYLRAPVAGAIHDLIVPASGSVIAAGATLAQILPDGRAFEIEAAIAPEDIDKLREGQKAEVLLTAFDPRAASKLQAIVSHLPPDAVQDPITGRNVYRVTLTLDADAIPADLEIRAGMDAQVFVATGPRSLIRWLLSPVALPLAKALREG